MRKAVLVAAVLVALMGAAYAAGKDKDIVGSWRYKMTVTVETPEGIKTGSAVREVEVKLTSMYGQYSESFKVRGEAVAVDLGERGVLFALMRGRHGRDYAYRIIFDAFPHEHPLSPDGVRYYSELKSGRFSLEPEDYPMFIHFKDLKEPKTVGAISATNENDAPYGVHGRATMKALKNVYGEGVKVQSVMLEITEADPTWQIDKWLPWLETLFERKSSVGFFGQATNGIDMTGLELTGTEFSQGKR